MSIGVIFYAKLNQSTKSAGGSNHTWRLHYSLDSHVSMKTKKIRKCGKNLSRINLPPVQDEIELRRCFVVSAYFSLIYSLVVKSMELCNRRLSQQWQPEIKLWQLSFLNRSSARWKDPHHTCISNMKGVSVEHWCFHQCSTETKDKRNWISSWEQREMKTSLWI